MKKNFQIWLKPLLRRKEESKRNKVTNLDIDYEEMKNYTGIDRKNRVKKKVFSNFGNDDLEGKVI